MNENPQNDVPQFSKPFGNKLVELADISPGAAVLDVGMGNGSATFFPAVEKVGEHGQVIGIDISDEMVRQTQGKIREDNLCNALVIKTDAESLIFKDNTFDVVLSGFSYLYTTFEEIVRVLKEGGQFGLTTWERLEDEEWMVSFIKGYVPLTGGLSYCDTEDGLRERLQKAGFVNVKVITEEEVFVYRNEEQWWEEMQEGWKNYLKKIEEMGPGKLEEFKENAFKELQAYTRDDGLHVHVSALIGLGTKRSSKV